MLLTDRQQKRLHERSVDMIILLTDGMPNSGERARGLHSVLCFCVGTQFSSVFHI